MAKAVGVQINFWEQVRNFAPSNDDLVVGDKVIVKTEQGADMGVVKYIDQEVDIDAAKLPLILRKANADDIARQERYEERSEEAVNTCRELVTKHNLLMKLVGVYYSFDGSRMTFTFTAEARVDFRSLVRDLTRNFQKSIRLQQIGSRDEAKMTGAVGMCGQEVCCTRFLKDFASITTDMARVQQMTHRGSERISGVCGRLMCCLDYEAEQYREWLSHMPELGSIVKTKQGKGKVIDRNLPKQSVRVLLDDKERTQIEVSLDTIR
ncbi:stage 0 sporulation family protein [Patescibacteria group bacterium]